MTPSILFNLVWIGGVLAIGLAMVPSYVRMVNGLVLSLRENDYITAARLIGQKERHILLRHLLPNSFPTLSVLYTVNLGTAVAGIKGMIATGEGTTLWNQVMAAMLLTLIPPVVIVLAMQRAFVRGLVDSEK